MILCVGKPEKPIRVKELTHHVDEGVIKFSSHHRHVPVCATRYGSLASVLSSWRTILHALRIIGQDPSRYGGAGFGNLSARIGAPTQPRGQRSFIITGSQTGTLSQLTLDQYVIVENYAAKTNRVTSHGRIAPSSESLTHGAIYDLGTHIRFVFHGHAPLLWRAAHRLKIPTTSSNIAYGTPEMAHEVARLFQSTPLSECRIFAMGGHEDGIVSFGKTAEEAGTVLVTYLSRCLI